MVRCLRPLLISVSFLMGSLLLLSGSTLGLNPTYDLSVGPGEHMQTPIPGTSKISVDIKVTSDIPVDMYVMTQGQIATLESNLTTPSYEEKFTDVTSKTFKYENKEGGMRWVVIKNEASNATANVTVEFKVLEEVGSRITHACCGSTMFIGMSILAGIVSILYILKRR